jgi:hypothetical protein
MYRAGQAVPAAFVEVRLFQRTGLEAKKRLTQELFGMMERELGIKPAHLYLNILELDTWGAGGALLT